MAGHKHKTAAELAWLESRDQARLVIRSIMRRVENEVFAELDQQFKSELAHGKLARLRLNRTNAAALIARHAEGLKGV